MRRSSSSRLRFNCTWPPRLAGESALRASGEDFGGGMWLVDTLLGPLGRVPPWASACIADSIPARPMTMAMAILCT